MTPPPHLTCSLHRHLLAVGLLLASACQPPVPAPSPPLDTGPDPSVTPVVPSFSWLDVPEHSARVAMPDEVAGLVWVFHGSDGDLTSVRQTEWIALYNAFIERGLAPVLSQSQNRAAGRWSDTDIGHLSALFHTLVTDHGVPSNVPMGAMAFSQGARMVEWMLDADAPWPLDAATVHQGIGEIDDIPTMYVAAENDEVGRTEAYYADSGIVEACHANTGDCRLRVGREVLVHSDRFTRLPRVDLSTSTAYVEDLERLGLIDRAGQRLVALGTRADTNRHIQQFRRNAAIRNGVESVATQLRVAWATHRLSAEFADEEADFLADHMLR